MKSLFVFFKRVIATFLGVSLFFLLLLAGAMRIVKRSFELATEESIQLGAKQVLRIKLKGNIYDMREQDKIGFSYDQNKTYVNELAFLLEKAAHDNDIGGVLIEMGSWYAKLVTLDRIKRIIQKFKQSGKPVVCYSHSPLYCGQLHIYLGSYADYHMVHPLVNVCLEGFSIKKPFFKHALDWIGIKGYAFYGGDTKSGLDSLVRSRMKASVKKRNFDMIIKMQDLIHRAIAKKRHIDMNLLAYVADQLCISTGYAREIRLIDGIGYMKDVAYLFRNNSDDWAVSNKSSASYVYQANNESDGRMENDPQGDEVTKDQKNKYAEVRYYQVTSSSQDNHAKDPKEEEDMPIYFVSAKNYMLRQQRKNDRNINPKINRSGARSVGYIHLAGQIIDGESSMGYIGDQDTIKMLYDAADLYDVLVISIDSPGGSAVASDSMRNAIADISNRKDKLVIAVMENICTSGGLMMALGANTIWCHEGTITLSIGVYHGFFYGRDFLANRCKIGVDGVKTNKSSDIHQGGSLYSPLQDRNLSEKERIQWQDAVDRVYDYFLYRAERGERLSQEAVDIIAGGFVCLGTDAVKYGIADQLINDLGEAIDAIMYQRYPNEDYTIYYHTSPKDRLGYLLGYLRLYLTKSLLGSKLYKQYQQLVTSTEVKEGVQAYTNIELDDEYDDR